MTIPNTEAKAMLKNAGLYCTAARVAVIQALAKIKGPVKQDQITRLLHRRFDRVTVYRTLESLLKADLIHKVFLEERACHYELARYCSKRQCHPHFTCTECGRTHCLMDLAMPLAKSPYKGFVIQRQQIRFEGLCPDCV